MSTQHELWLSAGDLAKLGKRGVAGLPTSTPGCSGRALKDEWLSREVKGGGGPGGRLTEYQPPFEEFVQIKTFLDINPDFFKKKRGNTATQPALIKHKVRQRPPEYEGQSVSIDQYVDVRGSAGPGAEVHEEAIVKVRVDAKLLYERVGSNFKQML